MLFNFAVKNWGTFAAVQVEKYVKSFNKTDDDSRKLYGKQLRIKLKRRKLDPKLGEGVILSSSQY